jgi:ADP-L-glycero-D-manno-heptose 6-epimerase
MIIVTGGAGMIGSAFVWFLNTQGIDNIVIVDNLNTSEKWKNLITLRYRDYCHKDRLFHELENNPAYANCEAIVHLGACSSTTELNADYLMENNYRYTLKLATWALEHNVYFMYASSAATYGDGSLGFNDDHATIKALRPLNRYGYSKQFFDLKMLENGWEDKLVGLKFFNVFGPNEYHKGDMKSVVCKAYDQILQAGTLKLFKSYKPNYEHGGQKRDFIYVKDCVKTMGWLLNNRQVKGIFNVGTGQARTWNDVANGLFKAMKKSASIEYIEMPDSLKNQYQYFTEASMDKLKSMGYGVEFSSLEEAIEDYVGYMGGENRYLGG